MFVGDFEGEVSAPGARGAVDYIPPFWERREMRGWMADHRIARSFIIQKKAKKASRSTGGSAATSTQSGIR
jgi:hypothetical protein